MNVHSCSLYTPKFVPVFALTRLKPSPHTQCTPLLLLSIETSKWATFMSGDRTFGSDSWNRTLVRMYECGSPFQWIVNERALLPHVELRQGKTKTSETSPVQPGNDPCTGGYVLWTTSCFWGWTIHLAGQGCTPNTAKLPKQATHFHIGKQFSGAQVSVVSGHKHFFWNRKLTWKITTNFGVAKPSVPFVLKHFVQYFHWLIWYHPTPFQTNFHWDSLPCSRYSSCSLFVLFEKVWTAPESSNEHRCNGGLFGQKKYGELQMGSRVLQYLSFFPFNWHQTFLIGMSRMWLVSLCCTKYWRIFPALKKAIIFTFGKKTSFFHVFGRVVELLSGCNPPRKKTQKLFTRSRHVQHSRIQYRFVNRTLRCCDDSSREYVRGALSGDWAGTYSRLENWPRCQTHISLGMGF